MSVTPSEDTAGGIPTREQIMEMRRFFDEAPAPWADSELAQRIAEDRPQLNITETVRNIDRAVSETADQAILSALAMRPVSLEEMREAYGGVRAESMTEDEMSDTVQGRPTDFSPLSAEQRALWGGALQDMAYRPQFDADVLRRQIPSHDEVRRIREAEYQRYMNACAAQAAERVAGEWAADRLITGRNPQWNPVPEMTEEPRPAYLKLSDMSEMFVEDLMVKMAVTPATEHVSYDTFSTYVSHHFPMSLLASYIDEAMDEFINNEQQMPRKIVAPEAIILRVMQLDKFKSMMRVTTAGYLKADVRSCIQIKGTVYDQRPSFDPTLTSFDLYAGRATIRLPDPGF